MSVVNDNRADGCWYCSEPLPAGSIIVYWHGGGGELALHPLCAERLGSTLIFEAGRAGMIERGQNVLAGVVCRVGRGGSNVVELQGWRGGR